VGFILLGVIVGCALLALRRSLATREVALVPLPGSNLVLVLTEDFKSMYRYQLFENGVAVSEVRLLGIRYSEKPQVVVKADDHLVSVDLGNLTPRHFVKIDVQHRVVLSDSNRAGRPPQIRTKE
jgi:hypothetical protein